MRAQSDFRPSYTKTIMYSLTCVHHATLDVILTTQLFIGLTATKQTFRPTRTITIKMTLSFRPS